MGYYSLLRGITNYIQELVFNRGGEDNIMEKEIKLSLINESTNETICSIYGCLYWEENQEEPNIYFQHVMNGSFQQDVFQVLQGWSEVEEKDNNDWYQLCKMIYNDEDLLLWFDYNNEEFEERKYYV